MLCNKMDLFQNDNAEEELEKYKVKTKTKTLLLNQNRNSKPKLEMNPKSTDIFFSIAQDMGLYTWIRIIIFEKAF